MSEVGQLRIRRATEADLAAVCVLVEQLDELHRRELPWLLHEQPEPVELRPSEYLTTFVTATDRVALVAERDRILGAVLVLMRRIGSEAGPMRPASVAEVDTLVVEEGCRRQGIGRALMASGLSWAHEQGASWLELGVYEFNGGARCFYEALGFATLSRRLRKTL